MRKSYYEDSRLTYKEAEQAVTKFIAEYGSQRNLVSAKEICEATGETASKHNQQRIRAALDERFVPDQDWSAQRKKYRIEES